MNRRSFHKTVLSAAAGTLCGSGQGDNSAPYQPTWESLSTHQVPDWFRNAKLGIFIHWGLYSVPAWAPVSGELHKVPPERWFIENAYAEWYLNSLRITGSPTWQHHMATWGKDFDYYSFMPMFNKSVANWDPQVWARLFDRVG